MFFHAAKQTINLCRLKPLLLLLIIKNLTCLSPWMTGRNYDGLTPSELNTCTK